VKSLVGGRQKGGSNGRREGGAFAPIPCSVLTHPNRFALTFKANKLLLDLVEKLRFKPGGPVNNGDLNVVWREMKTCGWRSKETLWEAVRELEYYGFVKQTRQGGMNRCSLYAVTWWAINNCGGKLEVCESQIASNEWKDVKPKYKRTKPQRMKNRIAAPIIVLPRPDIRSNCQFSRLTMVQISANCPDSRTDCA
jgi:hypothetical protein